MESINPKMRALPKEFVNFLQDLRKTGKFCDIKIYIDTGIPHMGHFEGPILCHSIILSYNSPFFKLYLNNLTDANKGEITLSSVSLQAMEHLINYFYTGSIDEIPINTQNVLELQQAAKKCQVNELQVLCENFLSKPQSPYGNYGKRIQLRDLTFDNILNHLSSVTKTTSFFLLSFDVIQSIILKGIHNNNNNNSSCTHQELMKCAASWLQFDPVERKQYLESVLEIFPNNQYDTLNRIFIQEIEDSTIRLPFLEAWSSFLIKTIDRKSYQVDTPNNKHPQIGVIHPVSSNLESSRERMNDSNNKELVRVERPRVKRELDPNSIHLCHVCNQPFDTIPKLRRHLSTHPGQRPWPCDACGKTFRHQPEVYQHKKYHHVQTGSWKCERCNCSFQSEKLYNRHCRSHETDQDDSDMSNHGQNSSTQNSFQNQSPGIFNQQQQQTLSTSSFQNKHNPGQHFLSSSSFNTPNHQTSSSSINQQFQNHTGGGGGSGSSTGPYQNQFTNQFQSPIGSSSGGQFHNSGVYQNNSHRQGQVGESALGNVELVWGSAQCNICHRSFSNSFVLEGHMRTSHVENGLYPCQLCNCKFDSPRGLSTHRGIYHNLNRKNLHKLCTNKGDSSSSTVESPMDHHQNNHSSLVANSHSMMQQPKLKVPRGRKKKKLDEMEQDLSMGSSSTNTMATPAFRMNAFESAAYERDLSLGGGMRVDGTNIVSNRSIDQTHHHLPIGVYARSRSFMDFGMPDF